MSRPMRRASSPRRPRAGGYAWVLAPPTLDDAIRLLRAWRFWLLGGIVGALLGSAVYVLSPPPYRARAAVNVDFHMEEAWPQDTDRQQFYYLERQTRKMVEIAISDATLGVVADEIPGVTLQQLRAGAAQLSQPGNGGWHFYATDDDPERARQIAATWARAFCDQIRRMVAVGSESGLERYITVELVQAESLPLDRTQGIGSYMLVAAVALLALAALGTLFFRIQV